MDYETILKAWDLFFLLMGFLAEFALFTAVACFLMWQSRKFLDRVQGVQFMFFAVRPHKTAQLSEVYADEKHKD